MNKIPNESQGSTRPASTDLNAAPATTRPRASNEIIRFLLQEIASNELPSGSRLPTESDLARHFKVSQPTVREAVRALDAMGLLEVRHGSGTYVTGDPRTLVSLALRTMLQMENVSMNEVLEMRATLGEQSARSAVRAATDEDLATIEALVDRLEKVEDLRDPLELAEGIVAFQAALSAASHNALVYSVESFLIGLLIQFQLAAEQDIEFWRHWSSAFADDRRRLVEALKDRDEEGAAASMAEYLRHLGDYFSSNPALASINLSDPDSLRTVADIAVTIPDFRPRRRASAEARAGG